jgi:hypothetical protein
MLNRESTEWGNAPVWVKIGLLFINTRRTALIYELGSLTVGLLSFIAGFFYPPAFVGMALFFSAYWYATSIRWADNSRLWGGGA